MPSDAAERMKRGLERQRSEPDKKPISKALSVGKTYPHRITLDLTAEMYDRLQKASAESGRTMAVILRRLIDQADDDLLL